jgi:hypothetical protein
MDILNDLQSVIDNQLLESGFSRIAQIMSGLVPTVKTFTIVTWENPMIKELTKKENEERNNKLKEILNKNSYGYRQITGKYGNIENPFFIMNITEKDTIDLGKQGEQQSVIHGIIIKEFDVTFKMIFCFTNEVYERHIWKSKDKAVNDLYSVYKGKKFYIPFFDEEYKDSILKKVK